MLTSKGAAGVTGSGFVTLAATLAVFPSIPVEGMALILGVDRFMSEARAVTNLIGNGVATVVVSKMEGEFIPQTAEVLSASKKAGQCLIKSTYMPPSAYEELSCQRLPHHTSSTDIIQQHQKRALVGT
ncbi:cation:dicarboxylase symporter family transporter [Paenibacillus mucilaginosus]|nr:cation:dicarboxylase symporter family transporter [Paenibacillus mucilaginosus]